MDAAARVTAMEIVALLVAIPGCTAAGASARAAEPNASQASAVQDRAACHIELPDAQVTIAELADGVILNYATEPNQVAALRDTIRRYVDWQNHPRMIGDRRHLDDVPLATGVVGAPPATGILLPGAKAAMSATPTGARLTLSPVPTEEQRLLRAAIAGRGRVIPNRHPCPSATQLSGHVPIAR